MIRRSKQIFKSPINLTRKNTGEEKSTYQTPADQFWHILMVWVLF
jgi:hypothetical protein